MGKKFKAIYNITFVRRDMEYVFNTSSEAQSRRNRKRLISSSHMHHMTLITDREASFGKVYLLLSNLKQGWVLMRDATGPCA